EIEVQRLEKIHCAALSETWHGHARLEIQRDETKSWRDRDNAFLCAILPVGDTTRVGARSARFAIVLRRPPCPERFAGTCIGGNNRAARTQGEIKDAIDHDRSDFRAGGSEVVKFPAPCHL